MKNSVPLCKILVLLALGVGAGSCTTAPPTERRSLLIAHDTYAVHAGAHIGAVYLSSAGQMSHLPEIRVIGEAYYHYNIGLLYQFHNVPAFRPAHDTNSDPEYTVNRSGYTLAAIGTIPLADHLDVSAWLGPVLYGYDLNKREYNSTYTSGGGWNSGGNYYLTAETAHGLGIEVGVRVSFPVWYWRPGVLAVLNTYPAASFDRNQPDIESGYSASLFLDLLTWSTERRWWNKWDK
jgi:hypothetical protein